MTPGIVQPRPPQMASEQKSSSDDKGQPQQPQQFLQYGLVDGGNYNYYPNYYLGPYGYERAYRESPRFTEDPRKSREDRDRDRDYDREYSDSYSRHHNDRDYGYGYRNDRKSDRHSSSRDRDDYNHHGNNRDKDKHRNRDKDRSRDRGRDKKKDRHDGGGSKKSSKAKPQTKVYQIAVKRTLKYITPKANGECKYPPRTGVLRITGLGGGETRDEIANMFPDTFDDILGCRPLPHRATAFIRFRDMASAVSAYNYGSRTYKKLSFKVMDPPDEPKTITVIRHFDANASSPSTGTGEAAAAAAASTFDDDNGGDDDDDDDYEGEVMPYPVSSSSSSSTATTLTTEGDNDPSNEVFGNYDSTGVTGSPAAAVRSYVNENEHSVVGASSSSTADNGLYGTGNNGGNGKSDTNNNGNDADGDVNMDM